MTHYKSSGSRIKPAARGTVRTRVVERYARAPRMFEATTLLRALVQCLDSKEVCFLLEKHASQVGSQLREALLRRVALDVRGGGLTGYLSTIRRLVAILDTDSADTSRSVGYCVSQLVGVLPTSVRDRGIRALMASRYVTNRRRGYKLALHRHRCIVQAAWENHGDTEAALIIVKHSLLQYVRKNARDLLDSLYHKGHRARLQIRVGAHDPSILQELRQTDDISYAYVLSKLGRKFSNREAMRLLKRNIADERLGLLVWSFGQQKLWPTLTRIVRRSLKLETERQDAVRELMWARFGMTRPQNQNAPAQSTLQ